MLEIDRYSNRVRYKILRNGELLKKETSEFLETDTPLCSYTGCVAEASVTGEATVRHKRKPRRVRLIFCQAHSELILGSIKKRHREEGN